MNDTTHDAHTTTPELEWLRANGVTLTEEQAQLVGLLFLFNPDRHAELRTALLAIRRIRA